MVQFKIILLLLALYGVTINCTLIKFTNIVCEEFDKSFADFKECKLKVMGRNKVALRLTVRLFQVPVRNITVSQ